MEMKVRELRFQFGSPWGRGSFGEWREAHESEVRGLLELGLLNKYELAELLQERMLVTRGRESRGAELVFIPYESGKRLRESNLRAQRMEALGERFLPARIVAEELNDHLYPIRPRHPSLSTAFQFWRGLAVIVVWNTPRLLLANLWIRLRRGG